MSGRIIDADEYRRLRARGLTVEPVWCAEAASLLAAQRAALGLTQAQLAEQAGITQQYIAAFETCKRSPNRARLTKVCEILGLRWYQPPVVVVALPRFRSSSPPWPVLDDLDELAPALKYPTATNAAADNPDQLLDGLPNYAPDVLPPSFAALGLDAP